MSTKYKIRDQQKLYFVSFAVVYWLDVFIRNEYKTILLDSLKHCQKTKSVLAGFVDRPEAYIYSSARDYAGEKGLLDIQLIQ
jgi:hypothetical protein